MRVFTAWLVLTLAAGGAALSATAAQSDPRDAALVDQTGAAFTLRSLGRPALVTFTATRCVDACPLATAAFVQLRRRLARERIDAGLVEITLDPEHDTPFVMARYARGFGIAPGDFRLAGGRVPEVRRLMRAFGITAVKDRRGVPDVHSTFVYVLDRRARLIKTLLLSTHVVDEADAALRAVSVHARRQTREERRLPLLDALLEKWSAARDYGFDVDAHEQLGTRTEDQTLRYRTRPPDRARLEVIGGSRRGGVALWKGGSQVVAYQRGLSLVKLHLDARDPRVLSLRGNGIFSPDIVAALRCFEAHRDRVSEGTVRWSDGRLLPSLTLHYLGFQCPHDAPGDRDVTADEIVVGENDVPVLRERREGAAVVERWWIRDVRIDTGLKEADFR